MAARSGGRGRRRKGGAAGRRQWYVALGAVALAAAAIALLATAEPTAQEKGAPKGAPKAPAAAKGRATDTVAATLQRVLSSAEGWCVDSLAVDTTGPRTTVFAPCGKMAPLKEVTATGLRSLTPAAGASAPSVLASLGAPWWLLALAALGAMLGVFNLFRDPPRRGRQAAATPPMGGPTRGGGGGGQIVIGGQAPSRAAPQAAPPDGRVAELSREVETLRRQHEQLQQKLEAVVQRQQALSAQPGPLIPTPPRGQPAAQTPYSPQPGSFDTPVGGFPAAGGGAPAAGDFLGGALSADDDRVHLRQSSRPMLEIRWAPGAAEAAVTVNPEFRFGDLNAALLAAAFDVDGGGGAGRYETVVPARVEWGPGATAGRVKARGRARPLGA